MPGIYNALEEHCIDVCILTETKWTFVTGDGHVLDKRWRAARVDFDSVEMDRANIPSLQRGGLCLLVRSSLQAEAFLLQKREGPLNMAQWRLMSPKWTSNIVLSGVYRSPSDNTTAVVEDQMRIIEAYMDTPRLDMNRKRDILLMAGDLNAKTGAVDVPQLLPPQISRPNHFPCLCPVGKLLNTALLNQKWMIASGRREAQPAPTRSIWVLGKGWEESIIDYILCKQSDYEYICSDKVYPQSGASLARADHNLVLVDISMARFSEASAHQGQAVGNPPSLSDRYPISCRSRFRLAPLIQNKHSQKSRASADVLGYDPTLTPRQIYAAELTKALASVSLQTSQARTALQKHNTKLSKVELSSTYSSICKAILQSLEATVGSHTASGKQRSGIQWELPPSPKLNALAAVKNQTKQALIRAREAKSSDADALDEDYQLLCRRFAKELVSLRRDSLATSLANIALRSRDPRAGWLQLQRRLRSHSLGLPVHVRNQDGVLLTDKGESARFWHVHREKVGLSHLSKPGFCQPSLQRLLAEEEKWAQHQPAASASLLRAINKEPISLDEVLQALEVCPYGSAPGLDDVPFEAFKCGSPELLNCLTDFFNILWSQAAHPSQWDEALIAPLFKGGPDPHDVSKYRAITLLCTSCKLYEGILSNRITTILNSTGTMSPSQSGFRPGVSAHETVAALKSVLDGRKARQLNTFVAFIDFETAFPSTFKPLVWNRLAEAGVQGHLWRVT
jgi:hypothetical protein